MSGSSLLSESAAATQAFGEALAARVRAGDVILLHGDLGSGKTTLAQGIIGGLGVDAPAASPTFTIANEYAGVDASGNPLAVAHLDLYRLGDDAALDSIGLDDYLNPTTGITLIEWPERAADRLGSGMLLVQLAPAGAEGRLICLAELGDAGRYSWLESLVRDSVSQIRGIAAAPPDDTPGTTSPASPPAD